MKKPIRLCLVSLILCIFMPAFAQSQSVVPQSREDIRLSFAPVVKQVAPAVVNIYVQRRVQQRVASPFMGDPFFERFFGRDFFERGLGGGMREQIRNSLGSGFIIDEDGLIVTNAHVIDRSDEIIVQLSDGRQYDAQISLIDEPSDIALLRIAPRGDEVLPSLSIAPSESLEVGDIVLAIGNPFGVGQTVTSGIVSALSRAASDINDFNFFIQTDAAINPGNSGGPLVSLDGSVVGVNTAIFSRDGGSMGIGFAVPSEMVASVIAADKAGQTNARGIVRPWIGMEGQSVTQDVADSLDLDAVRGVIISKIHPKGPAKDAGLEQGDIIMAINGRDIRSAESLKFRFATLAIGEVIRLSYLRDGKLRETSFKAIAPIEEPKRNTTLLTGRNPLAGLSVVNVSPAIEEELSLKHQEEGVVVFETREEPRRYSIALRKGDGIMAVNGEAVVSVDHLVKLLKRFDGEGRWTLTIQRDGRTQRILLQ